MTTRRTPLMDISNNDVTSSPAATGGRRKSGRAVKAPEKFVPDAPSSQAAPTSAKRKRGEEEVENDASDIEDEAEASDATLESADEEELRETRKRAKTTKKPAAKKAKVNGTAPLEDAPAVKLPNRPKKIKKVVINDDSADGLYAEVFTSGDSLEDVASIWLGRFKEENVTAMAELVNFILKCAGCTIQITADDINDEDNVENKLGDIQEEYQAQNITDYPLISKARTNHAFRTSLISFFECLIKAIHESGLMYGETAIIEAMHLWLATMSSSTSRPFRHTATLISLTVTNSLCTVVKNEIETAAKALRQLDGEKKKKSVNKARLADFQNKVTTNEQHKEMVEVLIKDFFDTVYVHRYRDIDPKIRVECVEALGNWILELPGMFLDGEYLRYMGWMLSDTHVTMRQEVLKQLTKIMKKNGNEGNLGGMHHFIERFRPRMVEIAARDAEPVVRASAVELIDMIREVGMLEPDDIDVIGKLIFDTEPMVRKALVGFFAANIKDLYESKVEDLGGDESLEDFLTVEDEDNYDTPRAGWIKLKCLAEILLSYDLEDQDEMPSQIDAVDYLDVSGNDSRFTLAALALYEKVVELKEWEMLAGYLLFDHSSRSQGTDTDTEVALKESFKPSEQEELVLLEILNAVVKLSLSQSEDSQKAKKRGGRIETSETREIMARHLASLIPRLLKKFGADPKTATVVLRLEHVLNLGVFQELRQDSTAYAKLLDEISTQFSSHADKGVLSEAGAALLHARGFEELEEVTETKVQGLWENTINALRKISKAGEMAVRGGLKNKVLTDLSHTLARLEQLASISNCVEPLETSSDNDGRLPINILLDIVARGVYEDLNDESLDTLEDDISISAMRSAMFYFMWKVRDLIATIKSGDDIPDIEIDHLREWQDLLTANLTASFSSRSSLDPVRLLGAGTLLDMHVLFSTLIPKTNAKGKSAQVQNPETIAYLQSLVKEVAPEVQKELMLIFDALEKQYAKRSKKKLADPSEDEEPEDLDSESEDEDFEAATDSERQSDMLKAEKQLCELTGKLVLAIIAKVIDASGPLKGKLRSRMVRNQQRLGANFRQVLTYLDDPKPKGKKSHKSKAQQAADAAKKAVKEKSALVVEEESDDDPFADDEPEEGTAEDLRRRELVEDDEPLSPEENGETADVVEEEEEDDDDVMGD
ncbi:Cohesin subunit psc3 [Lachnellula arida]|uniref:Cohesin subunit psc3 n=1 Tax=Lachnellula arida TaxID=1316785 RepID=A0A8T9B167_9HELO|nr:Cohesin subunit psc3 [Lachnellula arida]